MAAIFTFLRWAVGAVLVGALLLAWLAAWLPGDIWVLPALLALGFPFLWLGNILLLAWGWYAGDRWFWLPLCLLLLSAPRMAGLYKWGSARPEKLEGWQRVLSYNVHYFNYLQQQKKASYQSNIDSLLAYIDRSDAGILCLQEFAGVSDRLSKQVYQKMLAYPFVYQAGGSSLAIYSRFPIVDKGLISFPKSHNSVIWADISLNGRRLRVYNMHLQSVGLGADAEHVFDNPTQNSNAANQAKYRRIGSKLSHAFALRAEQVRTLRAHIAACPYPLLLAGDLNDTPASYAYGWLSSLLYDSFGSGNGGFGSTYNGRLPFLRIDYVFFSGDFRGYYQSVGEVDFSDHDPILVDFALK